MEWLSNLLGFANNGTSPFGSLSGSTSMTPAGGTPAPALPPPTSVGMAPGMNAGTPGPSGGGVPAMAAPAAGAAGGSASPVAGMQMPGLLGKLLGQQPQTGATGAASGSGGILGTGGAGTGANGALLGQALNLIKGQQIQPTPMMNLLSGPRG